jgi:hypothetical protein
MWNILLYSFVIFPPKYTCLFCLQNHWNFINIVTKRPACMFILIFTSSKINFENNST